MLCPTRALPHVAVPDGVWGFGNVVATKSWSSTVSSPSSRRAATDERSRLQFAESMKWYARVRERLVVENDGHIAWSPFRVVFGQASPNPVVYCFPVGVCYNSVMRRLGSEVIQAQMGEVAFPFPW